MRFKTGYSNLRVNLWPPRSVYKSLHAKSNTTEIDIFFRFSGNQISQFVVCLFFVMINRNIFRHLKQLGIALAIPAASND